MKIFLYNCSMYSCQLFLISSASARSILFLSFIVPIFAWNVCLKQCWMNYVFTLDPVFKSVLPKTQNLLDKPVCFTNAVFSQAMLNETMSLLGNLPFFKIHVNHFMARDNSLYANVISECMLWVRGLVPIFEFWDNIGTRSVVLGHKMIDMNLEERQISKQIQPH